MIDIFPAVVALALGFFIGAILAKPIPLETIPQAEARCAQAEGLKSLTTKGSFVCNNGLEGRLENKQ